MYLNNATTVSDVIDHGLDAAIKLLNVSEDQRENEFNDEMADWLAWQAKNSVIESVEVLRKIMTDRTEAEIRAAAKEKGLYAFCETTSQGEGMQEYKERLWWFDTQENNGNNHLLSKTLLSPDEGLRDHQAVRWLTTQQQ